MVKIKNKFFFIFALSMALVVTVSNYLVQFPVDYFGLQDFLTQVEQLGHEPNQIEGDCAESYLNKLSIDLQRKLNEINDSALGAKKNKGKCCF